ncbi:MAG TPA: hypothetical protein DCP67_05685, partial [Planctomycetaceae bacterium]|nr:hypothetical protein [Planctomycetaceae bacterium]
MCRLIVSIALVLSFTAPVAQAQWPQFRGPDGQGHSDDQNVPMNWSENESIAWKSAIPGEGWSS